jgi:hypothetical protein
LSQQFDLEEVEEEVLQWGADFEECVSTHFAVTHEEFENGEGGAGVNIYKIKDVFPKEVDGEDRSYFTTIRKLVPSSRGVMVYDEACLNMKWHSEAISETIVMGPGVASCILLSKIDQRK